MNLMLIVMPANSQLFMSAIFEKVTFNVFDTSSFTASFYTPTEPNVNDRRAELDYSSAFCFINLGSCIYLLFGQLIILLLESLLLAIFNLKCWKGTKHSKRAKAAKKWLRKQLSGVFWNQILTTINGA